MNAHDYDRRHFAFPRTSGIPRAYFLRQERRKRIRNTLIGAVIVVASALLLAGAIVWIGA
jgi:hypothetical protein